VTTQGSEELRSKIEEAFVHRGMPIRAVDLEGRRQIDSDVEEGIWFNGRDWRSITWKNWQEHFNAIMYFSNEALAYYLPSVLLLSLDDPTELLDAAQLLLLELDRSPSIDGSNDSFGGRLSGLHSQEYEVIKEWLLRLCEYVPYKRRGIAGSGSGDMFGRAFETVDLLQRETERLTALKRVPEDGSV
jgi:hypothetical protein